MPRWLKDQRNRYGEWSLTDTLRGYRICNYNHQDHGGPHLHRPINEEAGKPVPLDDHLDARRFVMAFADQYQVFTNERFQEELERWRSRSSER